MKKCFNTLGIKTFLFVTGAWLFFKANKPKCIIALFFFFLPLFIYIVIEFKKINFDTMNWAVLWKNYPDLFPVWMDVFGAIIGGIIFFVIVGRNPTTLDGFLRLAIITIREATPNDEIEIIFPSFNPGASTYIKYNKKYRFYKRFIETVEDKLKEGIKLNFYIIETDKSKWDDIVRAPSSYNSINEIKKIDDELVKYLIGNSIIIQHDFSQQLESDKKLVEYIHESANFFKILQSYTSCNIKCLKKEFADSKIVAIVNKHNKSIFMGTFKFDKGKDFSCSGIQINNKPTFDALMHCKEALLTAYSI